MNQLTFPKAATYGRLSFREGSEEGIDFQSRIVGYPSQWRVL
jgi:hypothetical protein